MKPCQLRRVTALSLAMTMICYVPTPWAQSQPKLPELKAKAEAGDAQAQVALGNAYTLGQGTPIDDAEAVRWFRKAAEQGDAAGEYSLGEMYALGRGVRRNYKQSAQWMQKAADQGDVRALSNLGAMYLNGLGVKKDEKKAFELTQQAARQGLAQAQFGLGQMYSSGRGVKQDLSRAVEWYTKAVEQGDAAAMNNLAWLLLTTSDINLRNTSKALDLALRAANTTQQKVPDYLDALATAYFDNGQPDKALEAEKTALQLSPNEETYRRAVKNYADIAEAAKRVPLPPHPGESVHAGPGVTAPKPIYTPDPTHSKRNGVVVLWLVVGGDGKPRDIKIARSLNPEADQKALDAVRRWIFEPARKNGQPVAVQINVEMHFQNGLSGPP